MFRMKDKAFEKGNPKKIANNFGTYTILFVALGAMTFFGVCTPQQGPGGLSGAAGRVGNEEISNAEFSRAYENYASRLRQQYGERYDSSALRVAHSVMDQLISGRVLYLKALELGLAVSEDEVVRMLSEAAAFTDEEGKFSSESFRNYLRHNRYSEASFMEEMQRNMTVQKLREFVAQSAFVSSKAAKIEYRLRETKLDVDYLKVDPQQIKMLLPKADVDAFLADDAAKEKIRIYYDSHKDDYIQEEQVQARHILVGFTGARNASVEAGKRSKEVARKRAEALLAQVKASGADFAKVAKAETDEPSGKKSGGDLGFFKRSDMVASFADAAFALKKGEISTIVESPFGFHVIKVTDRKSRKETTVDQARREIAEKILQRDKGPEFAKNLADGVLLALKESKPVDKTLRDHGLKWAKTGEFPINAGYISGLGSSAEIKAAVYSLRKPSQIYPEVLKSGRHLYILKLAKRQDAEADKLDQGEAERLSASAAFSEGYAYLGELERRAQKEFEDRKVIFRNPSYLALDDQVQN